MYRAVYEVDGENADAIGALERLYRQTSRHAELLGIYEKKRELSMDAAEKKAISYEIAKLYETEIKDVDKAIATYNAVLDDEPSDGRALAALDVLYRQLERWEPYVDVLRRRIELDVGEKELIDLKFRLAGTLEQHLADAPGALENYREILFLDTQHEGARTALEAFLTKEGQASEAASILETIYEERGDWKKLIGALEILANGEGDITRKVQLERKIARISADNLSDFDRAFTALAAALKDEPALAETRGEIEKVSDVSNAWPKLVQLYEEISKSITDAPLARDYAMRLGGLNERLGDVDAAAKGYAHVLSLDPADQEALAALEALFVRTQRWTDLIGVVERRIEQTEDPAAREQFHASVAQIYDEKLGSPEQAVLAYKKVLELDPASPRALAALDALFTRQKMWNELAENLEAQLALATTDEAQLGLMLRLAALRETEMGQIDVAIEGYRAILERDINSRAAFEALERLGLDARYELTIADLLEPLYRHLGDHTKLIGAHEVQVRRSEEPQRKVELLHQIAQLHEDAGGDMEAAFLTLARAMKEDPSSEHTQQQIDRVARATNRFQQLAQVFESLASRATDTTLASSLYMMSARVYEQDLGNVETAIQHYRKVLEIDPLNLAAAEALEHLFRGTERYADLSLILQAKAEIVAEPQEKKDALFQAASIEEDVLEKPEAAISVYKKVLALDEDDVRALDALIKRYMGLANWVDLLGVFHKKADLVADSEEKKRIYYQVGATYERELANGEKAIETYIRILELDPDDLGALSRLDVLYERAQNWAELLSVLTRESEMTDDPAEGVSFQYRIADLYEKRLDDVPRAIELYRDILQVQPDHGPTLDALEGLKSGERDPLGAAAVLEPVYEAIQAYPRLISVHEVQVAHAQDSFQKVDLLHRIARLYEDATDDHASSFDTYARALVLDNGNEDTLTNLERLATVINRWPNVASLYDAELDKLAENPDRFVELASRVAQIYEVQLEDTDNAIVRYRRVLEVEAENQNAIRSLDRLYSATERWGELAAILAREAEVGATPDEILEFKYRLGRVQQLRLANLDAAIQAYSEVLAAAPEHTPTLEALEHLFASGVKQVEIAQIVEGLYRAAGEWEKLTRVYEATLAHAQGQEDRLAQYYQLADLYEEKLIDPVLTLGIFIRALKEFPLDEALRGRGAAPRRQRRRWLGRRSRTRTPTCSGSTKSSTSSASSASGSRRRSRTTSPTWRRPKRR